MRKKVKKVSKDIEKMFELLRQAMENATEGKNSSQAEIDPSTGRMLLVSWVDTNIDGESYQIPFFFEIRYSVLMNLEMAAKSAGVDVRTIQRWRKDGLFCLPINGKPCFQTAYLKEYCESKDHKYNGFEY